MEIEHAALAKLNTGDAARRMGQEVLFQELAQQNIATLNDVQPSQAEIVGPLDRLRMRAHHEYGCAGIPGAHLVERLHDRDRRGPLIEQFSRSRGHNVIRGPPDDLGVEEPAVHHRLPAFQKERCQSGSK